MTAMAGDNLNNDNERGPMLGRFFDSTGYDEDGSGLSGSHPTTWLRRMGHMRYGVPLSRASYSMIYGVSRRPICGIGPC